MGSVDYRQQHKLYGEALFPHLWAPTLTSPTQGQQCTRNRGWIHVEVESYETTISKFKMFEQQRFHIVQTKHTMHVC